MPMQSILPPEEWPHEIPNSYVRAFSRPGTNWWPRGIAGAYSKHAPEEEIFKDFQGSLVLNGAGAVEKVKGEQSLQRFISIFCPLNSVSQNITGDEDTLPYVGQVGLLYVPDEAEVGIDSEDMASAFNLFLMPSGWRGMFCYEKHVLAHCLGLEGDAPTYVSLRTAYGTDLSRGGSAGSTSPPCIQRSRAAPLS